jgi:hypothetical protein
LVEGLDLSVSISNMEALLVRLVEADVRADILYSFGYASGFFFSLS